MNMVIESMSVAGELLLLGAVCALWILRFIFQSIGQLPFSVDDMESHASGFWSIFSEKSGLCRGA
jgi:hypothetical protein